MRRNKDTFEVVLPGHRLHHILETPPRVLSADDRPVPAHVFELEDPQIVERVDHTIRAFLFFAAKMGFVGWNDGFLGRVDFEVKAAE